MTGERKHVIERDERNRLRVQIDPTLAVGIKLLAEDNPRRSENRVHAYAVLDIVTELGIWRVREVCIVHLDADSDRPARYVVRFRQFRTGNQRENGDGEWRDEWLDIAGPQNRATRDGVTQAVLGVFHQIREAAASNSLPRRHENPRRRSLDADRDADAEAEARLLLMREGLQEEIDSDGPPEALDQDALEQVSVFDEGTALAADAAAV